MGLFQKIFGGNKNNGDGMSFFRTFTAYTPVFKTFSGAVYESQLVRASIDARARHISKLSIDIIGEKNKYLYEKLKRAPNSWQPWSKFLYRLSTILDVQNTAFIVPVFGKMGMIEGYYPVLPSRCQLVESGGEIFLRYEFSNGEKAAIEFNLCAVMTKFQYQDDFFGDTNDALMPTMNLISMNNQSIEKAMLNGNSYRFMAKVVNFTKASDLTAERERFNSEALKGEGDMLLLFPNTYGDIKQINMHTYNVDPAQMEMIQKNVFTYFGVNEKVLQNAAVGDELDAFYNGAIEPFAIQFSDVMKMGLFGSDDGMFIANANRLQYMSASAKIEMAKQLGDRGAIMIDEIRELFNYAPLPEGKGQHAPIRGEYYFAEEGKNEE